MEELGPAVGVGGPQSGQSEESCSGDEGAVPGLEGTWFSDRISQHSQLYKEQLSDARSLLLWVGSRVRDSQTGSQYSP